ncbi:MAG: AMP-binding protein [Clostridia bacterium]|nr:AMP-binding protein [Clostridia bacterium]
MAQDPGPRQLQVQTIKSILQFNAVRNPGAPALLLRSADGAPERVSYRKLLNAVNRLGTALLHRGLGGANIAVVGKNSADWCRAFLAVVCGTGAAVPVDREMTADSMLHITVPVVRMCGKAGRIKDGYRRSSGDCERDRAFGNGR